MDDATERKLLITEIQALEGAIISSGVNNNITFVSDVSFLESFSTADLKATKSRFERLCRSLGGTKH